MCLVGVEEYTLPITSIDVVLFTPHDYSGAFQGGYSARFTASRRVLKGARRALFPSQMAKRQQYSCHCHSVKYSTAAMVDCLHHEGKHTAV